MTTSKNSTSPTKVVSIRLQNEDYEKYVSEASDLDLDLSPHLMEKLKCYDDLQLEKEALENTFFDTIKERDNYHEEQLKLKAEIQTLRQNIQSIQKERITFMEVNQTQLKAIDESNEIRVNRITTNSTNQLKVEKDKLVKIQQEHAQLLAKKDEMIKTNEAEIADLKQEKIDTREKMEETVDKIIDKAYDYYWDAPVFSKKNFSIFEKPLKNIYFDTFPKPENKPLFSLSAGIANRVIEQFKKNYNF